MRLWIAAIWVAALTASASATDDKQFRDAAGLAVFDFQAMRSCRKQLQHDDIDRRMIFEMPYPRYQSDVWVKEREWWSTPFRDKIQATEEVACVLANRGFPAALFDIRGDISGKILATWKDGILTPN